MAILFLISCSDESKDTPSVKAPYEGFYFEAEMNDSLFYINENTAFFNQKVKFDGNAAIQSSTPYEFHAKGISFSLSSNNEDRIEIYFAKSVKDSLINPSRVGPGGYYIFKNPNDFHEMFEVGTKNFLYKTSSEKYPQFETQGIYIKLIYQGKIYTSYRVINNLYTTRDNLNSFEVKSYELIKLSHNYEPKMEDAYPSGIVTANFECGLYNEGSRITIRNGKFKGMIREY